MITWDAELARLVKARWGGGKVFTLEDVYQLENHFSALYPRNNNVRDKLRQVLQHLRDEGVLSFLDNEGT